MTDKPIDTYARDFLGLAVSLANGQAACVRELKTPIVEDMRSTARAFAIIDTIKEAQRHVYHHPAHSWDLLESALIALGCTNAELLENLRLTE